MRLKGEVELRSTQCEVLRAITGLDDATLLMVAKSEGLRYANHRGSSIVGGQLGALSDGISICEVPCGVGKTLCMITLACVYRRPLTLIVLSNEELSTQFQNDMNLFTDRDVNESLFFDFTARPSNELMAHITRNYSLAKVPIIVIVTRRCLFEATIDTWHNDLLKSDVMVFFDEAHQVPTEGHHQTTILNKLPFLETNPVFFFTGLFHKENSDLVDFEGVLHRVFPAERAVRFKEIVQVDQELTFVGVPAFEIAHVANHIAGLCRVGLNLVFCDFKERDPGSSNTWLNCKDIRDCLASRADIDTVSHYYSAGLNAVERQGLVEEARNLTGKRIVFVLCRAGDQGIDLKQANTGFVLTTNHHSLMQAAQRVGRLSRYVENKQSRMHWILPFRGEVQKDEGEVEIDANQRIDVKRIPFFEQLDKKRRDLETRGDQVDFSMELAVKLAHFQSVPVPSKIAWRFV